MEKEKTTIEKECPNCEKTDGQMKNGCNRSGSQRIVCRHCKKSYTLEPKRNAYGEETVALALKIYYAGTSGRGVGKILNMSKANVYNWIKKNESKPEH